MESVYIEPVLRPVEQFGERMNSIATADDTDASSNATENWKRKDGGQESGQLGENCCSVVCR